MAKKKNATKAEGKAVAKAAKKEKASKKVEKKDKKKAAKSKDMEDDDQDLEAILEQMRKTWETQHQVTEELVEGPPSRRANASLTPCPNGNHLWCIGGEFFSEDNKAHFYNDVFRYSPDKDEWRKFVSPTCPGPRSAHAVVASPASGGKLFLFGGEFSSLNQTTFHHYRDFWCFDITTHSWDRIETKVLPSARSGHRMAMWKHYVVLFGGFHDPGIRTNYLDDVWLFDTQEYIWKPTEFKVNERKPSPRSGFSFLPSADGILLHGGYCKEYSKGKRPVGVMLEDTWFLHMSMPTETDVTAFAKNMPILKWEKRKRPSTAYAPSIRSGCTMSLWQVKNMGILFGGVTDEDTNEETLESIFHNDLYGYQIAGNGRWVSLALKRPKQKGGAKKKKKAPNPSIEFSARAPAKVSDSSDGEAGTAPGSKRKRRWRKGASAKQGTDAQATTTSMKETSDKGSEEEPKEESSSDENEKPWMKAKGAPPDKPEGSEESGAEEIDPDDPSLTIPLPRYNAMSAVLRNTLFIYGGIFEKGSREYTLDDFHYLQLDKLDRFVCLKPTDVVISAGSDGSSSDNEDESDSGSDDHSSGDDNGSDSPVSKSASALKSKSKPKSIDEVPTKELKQLTVTEKQVVHADEAQGSVDKNLLPVQDAAFMGVAKDSTRSEEEVISTPLPGETLAMFYARSRVYWAQKAHESSDNRGKQLRKDGFLLANSRYKEYRPTLQEVEKTLAEAGLDEEEMRKSAAAGPSNAKAGESRNRR